MNIAIGKRDLTIVIMAAPSSEMGKYMQILTPRTHFEN